MRYARSDGAPPGLGSHPSRYLASARCRGSDGRQSRRTSRPAKNRRDPICFSPYLYRHRNYVERLLNQIKHCRRIAMRYEKHAANFLAFVKLAAIRLWLRVMSHRASTAGPVSRRQFHASR
nr:transposase [Nitratireductor arenosus]